MSISRLFFCAGFKLVCSTYYYYHSRFPSHHHHQLSYRYVSISLTPPKSRSSK
jgi:hypothetical protein